VFRHDGSPEAIQKCLQQVIDNIEEIDSLIHAILAIKRLTARAIYVFQSIPLGVCRTDGRSDIDTYVALHPQHSDLIDRKGTYIIEGHHPTSTYGTWHREELDPIDRYSTGYKWPYKILHDSQAPDYYVEDPAIPKRFLDRLDPLKVHINWGIHLIPPKKREYRRKHYISFIELRRLAGSLGRIS